MTFFRFSLLFSLFFGAHPVFSVCPPVEWGNNASRWAGLPCPTPDIPALGDALTSLGWFAEDVAMQAYPADFSPSYSYVQGPPTFPERRLIVVVGGDDIWGPSDSGRFILRQASSVEHPRFTFESKVLQADMAPTLGPWVKSAITIRQSRTPNSAYVILWWGKGENGTGRVTMQRRATTGAEVFPQGGDADYVVLNNVPLPCGLRLTKVGSTYTGEIQPGGTGAWQVVNTFTGLDGVVAPASVFYWGVAGTSTIAQSGLSWPWAFAMDYDATTVIPNCAPACDTKAYCGRKPDNYPTGTGSSVCRCLVGDGFDNADPAGAACPDIVPATTGEALAEEQSPEEAPPLLENLSFIIGLSVGLAAICFGLLLLFGSKGGPSWMNKKWNDRGRYICC